MQIIKDFIPASRRNRPALPMTPKYISVHDTANTQTGADAKAHAAYVKTYPNLEAGWHFTVCSKAIYQHLPLTENGWHASDGYNGNGNRQSIGIEICENKDGNRARAEENAAWLAAKLIKEVSSLLPFPACMKQHYDWSGKNCPRVLRQSGRWGAFLEKVMANLKPAACPECERLKGLIADAARILTG